MNDEAHHKHVMDRLNYAKKLASQGVPLWVAINQAKQDGMLKDEHVQNFVKTYKTLLSKHD